MKKSKFIKSTLILIIGGFLTKILGMVIKIVLTRLIKTEGIGLYMLITPTMMLLVSLAQLGMPTTISKLVAENKHKSKNLIFSATTITLVLNFFLIFILILTSNFIASNLLHEPRIRYALIATSFTLPFISISSILRGYFFGKQKMFPHVFSNVIEDIIRLIVIIIGVPIFLKNGLEIAITFVVISNIISEITSILVLFFFLPKNFNFKISDLKPNRNNLKDIFSISIPTTGSRLIGSLGYFFEPIIMTFFLLKNGYSNSFIINEYGILNGYVLPLILLPSFFTMAISQALIPVVSNYHASKKLDIVKSRIKQAVLISLIIGIPATIIFTFFPQFPLKFIYNTTEGISYIKFLAPICILHYIQGPLTSSLQAMGKAKESLKGTVGGILIKTIILIIGCNLKIGLWGLIISTSVNIIYVSVHNYLCIRKELKII